MTEYTHVHPDTGLPHPAPPASLVSAEALLLELRQEQGTLQRHGSPAPHVRARSDALVRAIGRLADEIAQRRKAWLYPPAPPGALLLTDERT